MKNTSIKKHLMIDLETLGTSPGCVVLSIGACTFDKNGIGASFYAEIDSADSRDNGLFVGKETIDWWERQSGGAKELLERCYAGGDGGVVDICARFVKFIYQNCESVFHVWGNGASFDEPIMSELLKTVGVQPPWKYHASRCYRTLHAIGQANTVPDVPFTGMKHNALDDAVHQALCAVNIVNALVIEL